MSAHTLEEAVARFALVKDTPGDGETTACAMSMLAWIDGGSEKWTDRPECVNTVVALAVIRGNDDDETTDLDRINLVRAGMTGALGTTGIPDVVAVAAIAAGNKAGGRRVDRTLESLRWLAAHKTDRGADLTGADLWGANLRGANLWGADLWGANLRDADLTDANLKGADLKGADLTDADLTDADLTDADLTGADLTGADLEDADLTGANLTGANLTGANRLSSDPPIPGWKTASGRLVHQGDEA